MNVCKGCGREDGKHSDLCPYRPAAPAEVEKPDMAVCPKCEKELLYSHSLGQLPNSPVLVAVAWCTHCKHLFSFQFIIVIPPPGSAPPEPKKPN
jgi:hypothetical protein